LSLSKSNPAALSALRSMRKAPAARSTPASKSVIALPDVNTSEFQGVRYLHLGSEWVQGSMIIKEPYQIHLEYVQRMMGWLLFFSSDSLPERSTMQLGLGSGAITKFCAKVLQLKTTAIELNPQVVAACRLWFKLPDDSDQLQVVLADAQDVVAHAYWRGQIDALQVDLYDAEAAAPVLDSAEFYQGCKSLLTQDGVMSVNLFGKNSQFDQSVAAIRSGFGEGQFWAFRPTKEGNTVVIAQRGGVALSREVLAERAQFIQEKYDLPADKWLKVLKPLN
jgi:spermidine synthase